ncbi:MAG: NAD(P)-dependent oxidoreductase [Gammaproteobacteria bacterium]|nr:NAD(P)-dependent oxidoreductase [Gammaproteobacteria bacterium]
MKKILLTGATGFLGSHLLKAIYKKYHCIILYRNRSSFARINALLPFVTAYNIDKIPLFSIFEQEPFDAIIHCATNYGRKHCDHVDILEANLIFPLKLLGLCEQYNIRTFLNTDTILDKRINDYTLSKQHFREWLNVFAEKMVCVNLALEHFYGPFDDPTKFVSFIIQAFLTEKPRLELTLGEQKRDFIYIGDVIEAFKKIIEISLQKSRGLFNYELGSGQTVSIRELILKIQSIIGNHTTELAFGALPYRSHEIMESKVNLTAITDLGWAPKVSLSEGLLQTINLERNHL